MNISENKAMQAVRKYTLYFIFIVILCLFIIILSPQFSLLARDKEDFDRISNVYIDIQNLAEEMDLDIGWTAHHITCMSLGNVE